MRSWLPFLGGLLAAVLCGQRTASAATRAWDGGGNGSSWSDRFNWNPDDTPDNNDDVTIGSGSVTVDVDTPALRSVTISGGTVTLGAGRFLRILGGGVNPYVQTGGTFNGASGGMSADGPFSISSTGNFTVPSGGLSIDGSFSKSGSGTFNGNGGTVTLTSTGSITTGGISFSSLTINSTVGGTYTVTGTLTTTSTLTVTAGTLSPGANAVSVAAYSQTGGIFTGGTGTVGVTGALTQSGGTFTGGSGAITAASVAISGAGNFTASSTTTTVSGSFSKAGTGTFAGNGGTVSLTGSGTVANNGSFSGLTVAASGTYSASGDLTATGTFTMASGTFNAPSGTLSVGGSFTRTGGTFAANGGTVLLTGAGTISTNGGSLNALTVNASGTYTLGGALTTSSTFTMTAGTVTGGASAISIGGSFIQTGGAFTAPSGTMMVTGTFDRTGGSFTANGGTLQLNSIGTVSHRFGGATLNRVVMGQESGMVGHWRLDEGAGAAIADSSGYGNGGTLMGGFGRTTPPAVLTSSINAVSFDGTAYSTLGVTGVPANNAVQSISCWVNLTSNAGVQNFIALINGASGSAVQVGIRNPNLIVWAYGGGTLASAPLPSTGVWHHVAYTFDGTTHRVYLDGVAGTSTTSAPQTATPTQTYLGSYNGSNEFLLGALDDVRVYNRLLSAADATTLKNGGNPTPGAGGTHTFLDAFVASGDLIIGTGTVTGTNTLTVGGSWLNTGGTFSGTGLVTLTGTSSTGVVTSNGSPFSSLTVSGSGGTYTFSDPMVDAGAFTIGSGAMVAGANIMSVGGNWDNSGTFIGTGTVTLTGTGPRTLKSNGSRFAALTLNGSGGTYTLQDRLSVPGGTVTLMAGTLAAGTNTVRVGTYPSGAGSFTHSGTLILDSASNQTLRASYPGPLRLEDPTETNLVAYWKLDAGAGRQVYDHTGNGNNGTLSATGASWQTSVGTTFGFDNPASVVFDGATGTATIPKATLPALGAAQTVSFWMNPTSMVVDQSVIALVNMTGPGVGIQLGIGGGTLRVWAYGGATLITGPAVTTGVWHHVVYTYDGAGNQSLTVDGVRTTATATNPTGSPTYAYLGTYTPNAQLFSGGLDEVRVYDAALSTAQIAQLRAGRYAGTGGIATYSPTANTTVTGQLFVDDAILDMGTRTMDANYAGAAAQVNTGTYLVGSSVQNFPGGLTINGGGTLSLATSGGAVEIGSGRTLTIDGTLTASTAMAEIRVDGSGSYAFKIGSTAIATPTLNVSGLTIRNTDANGLWIGGVPTSTRFDNVAFHNGATGVGSQYLQVTASALYLTAGAVSFGFGETGALPAVAVKVTGNGISDGETRVVLGGAKCATAQTDTTTTLCMTTWKSDDDAPPGDGVGDTPATNGGVAQFTRSASTDTAGTIEGFPVAAFDWNTFAQYATYAAFHDANGTADRIYARDQLGAALYSWDTATGETIVGTPRWASSSAGRFLYVAVNGATADTGKIYRLRDTGASLVLTSSPADNWSTESQNPFTACACTFTTPLSMDNSNLYWGGTTGSAQRVWRLPRALAVGSPYGLSSVSITPTITSATPAQLTTGGISYLLLGLTGHVLKVDVTNMVLSEDNTSPGAASVFGRIATASPRVFAGDDGGRMWALDINNFTGTNRIWSYAVSGSDPIKSSAFYDYTNAVLMFGTEGGKVIALNSSGTALPNYPYTPGTTTDAIRSALLYLNGILAVGTTTGKLYFIDRSQGAAAGGLVREYYFGPTQSVSGIAYDGSVSRYMVTTADPTTRDGRLYYVDQIADPTPGSP